MKNFHYSLSASSARFQEKHQIKHNNRTATSKRFEGFSLNKEQFPAILSIYSRLESVNDTAKSAARVRKSQSNIQKSVTSPISNSRIEIPAKVNVTEPTYNVSKVYSNKVYLSNVNRGLFVINFTNPLGFYKKSSIFTNHITINHLHYL